MTERRYLTLAETIVKMAREGKTNTPEFEQLVSYYGRNRLRALYALELGIRKEDAGCTLSLTPANDPPNNEPSKS